MKYVLHNNDDHVITIIAQSFFPKIFWKKSDWRQAYPLIAEAWVRAKPGEARNWIPYAAGYLFIMRML